MRILQSPKCLYQELRKVIASPKATTRALSQVLLNKFATLQMSAQASSGAGGDGGKLNKASRCERCGNRHEGECWPKCGTCGKVHKGACRYAQPVPSIVSRNAGQELSHTGYPQAYGMPSPYMRPGIPGMGGQVLDPFGSQYPAQYGNFGAATPAMGQGIGSSLDHTRSFGDKKKGVAEWHEIQKKIGRPRGNRKPKSKEESIGKKGEKDPLAAKPAGIVKQISKSANQRAEKTSQEKKGEEEKKDEEKNDEAEQKTPEQLSQDAMAGPVDFELLRLLEESDVEDMGTAEVAPVGAASVDTAAADDEMEDTDPPAEDVIANVGYIDAQSLIQEAIENPSGFQFPQDQLRVERMATLLEHYGQDRMLGLSESASANFTTILWEAFQIDLFDEQISEVAAGVPLPELEEEEL